MPPLPKLPPSRPPRSHALYELGLKGAAGVSLLAVLLVLGFIVSQALPLLVPGEASRAIGGASRLFATTNVDGVAKHVWQPLAHPPKYDIWPLLLGTLKVTAIAVGLGAPLGVSSAIYVARLGPPRLRQPLKASVELLAGIPTVVIGVFALLVLAGVVQRVLWLDARLNGLVAGLALAITVVPVVFTLAEDALSAVPSALTESAYALGATRTYTAVHVAVPAAMPGIFAGVILGFGHALGETMIVLLASGNAAIASLSLGAPARTVTASIAEESRDVVIGSPHATVLFALATVLLLLTIATNAAARVLLERLRRRGAGR